MIKHARFEMKFDVEYVSIPEDRFGAWRAGFSLLLQLLKETRKLWEAEFFPAEVEDGFIDVVDAGDLDGSVAALFSLAYVTEGEEVASIGGLRAWVVGHDGSVFRMALADW